MEVVTIEAGAFKNIVGMFETIQKTVLQQADELKKLKDNRLMSVQDVLEYTGRGIVWLNKYKDEINYTKPGKELIFYKEDIDRFLLKYKVIKK